MATTLFWPNRQNWCGCCNEALFELLNWPGTVFPVAVSKPGMQGERRWGGGLERFSSSRGVSSAVKGGFYFHPSDEGLSLGAPVRKKPLSSGGFPLEQLENRYRARDRCSRRG